jgi:hypothetical protein
MLRSLRSPDSYRDFAILAFNGFRLFKQPLWACAILRISVKAGIYN